MDARTTSPGPAAAAPAFVPLSLLPDPAGRPASSAAECSRNGPGVMTIEVGPDLLLRIPGDVAVERAAALARALRDAS